MNNEIEEGEYIRTVEGTIARIEDSEFDLRYGCFGSVQPFYRYFKEGKQVTESIKTHSKIKSEIVEVGDYVNGKLIHKIDKGPNYCYLYYGNCKTYVDYQIKSIVTKESFKEREYVF